MITLLTSKPRTRNITTNALSWGWIAPFLSFLEKLKHSSSHRALLKGEGLISESKIRATVETWEAACPSQVVVLVAWITFISLREGAEARDELAPFLSWS